MTAFREHPAGLVVELVGIPGAGKSRLARTLVAELADRGVDVATPQEPMGPGVPRVRRLARKAAAGGVEAVRHPGSTARLTRSLVRSAQPGAGDVAGRLVQWLVAAAVTSASARGSGVSLLDEGPVQALWSIGLRGDVPPVLAALDEAGQPPLADVLVVVRVPPDVALARLAQRPSQHSRTQLLSEADQMQELERGTILLDRLIAWQTRSAADRPRTVFTVRGSDSGAPDRAALVEHLSTRGAAGRPVG